MAKKQEADFTTTIGGIPCGIKVEGVLRVPAWQGDARNCPSEMDYYGYSEVEFTVLDRKGYTAEWLYNKMTSDEIENVENFITQDGRW